MGLGQSFKKFKASEACSKKKAKQNYSSVNHQLKSITAVSFEWQWFSDQATGLIDARLDEPHSEEPQAVAEPQ